MAKSTPLTKKPTYAKLPDDLVPETAGGMTVGDVYLFALPIPVVKILNGIAERKRTTFAKVLGEALSEYIQKNEASAVEGSKLLLEDPQEQKMDPTLNIGQLVATATSAAESSELAAKVAEGAPGNILDYLTGTGMFVAAGAIYVLPQILKRAPFIRKIMANQWVVRLMPLYPLVAAIAVVMLPGAVDLPDKQIGTQVVGIIWLAFLAMMGHKLIGQTLMGDDHRITTLAVKSSNQVSSGKSEEPSEDKKE